MVHTAAGRPKGNPVIMITSGVLAPQESMQLLMIGPKYEQIALKSEKAASQLKWLGGRVLSKDEVARYRAVVEAEQAEYQKLFAEAYRALYAAREDRTSNLKCK